MIRGAIFFFWLCLSLIPYALALVALSVFARGMPLYRIATGWTRQITEAARIIGGVRYEVEGLQNLPPPDGAAPIILAPKHQSAWETLALPGIVHPHRVAFVFKRELLLIPFFGWALGRLDMIRIDRSNRIQARFRVARQGQQLMAKGYCMLLFPEGTRTGRGERGNYKLGAARLALDTGASLVPIAVTSARCWPRRSFRLTPGTIFVAIGKPIPSTGRTPAELMREVEGWIEAQMRRLDPEAYGS